MNEPFEQCSIVIPSTTMYSNMTNEGFIFDESLISSPQLSIPMEGSDVSSPDHSSPERQVEYNPFNLANLANLNFENLHNIDLENAHFFSQLDSNANHMENTIIPMDQLQGATGFEIIDEPQMTPFLTESVDASSDNEGEQKPKRGRKKRQRREGESTDVSAVLLSKDQLLSMSSEDYDNLINEITKQRPLTFCEEKEIKRQRRLIKNRESAHASRQRKKEYVDQLESQIQQMKSHTNQLNDTINKLKTENRSLRDEVARLTSIITKTTSVASTKVKAGVYLLVVLFSFGLLFNYQSNMSGFSNLKIPYDQLIAQSVAHSSVIGTARSLLETQYQEQRTEALTKPPTPVKNEPISYDVTFENSRHSSMQVRNNDARIQIEEVEEQPKATPARLEYGTKDTTGQADARFHKGSINSVPANKERPVKVPRTLSFDDKMNMDLRDPTQNISTPTPQPQTHDEEVRASFMAEFMNESSTESEKPEQQAPLPTVVDMFGTRIKMRPNTAYFAVEDVKQVVRPNADSYDPTQPILVSWLIPAMSLPNHKAASEGDVIEILTQVIDISVSQPQFPPTTAIPIMS